MPAVAEDLPSFATLLAKHHELEERLPLDALRKVTAFTKTLELFTAPTFSLTNGEFRIKFVKHVNTLAGESANILSQMLKEKIAVLSTTDGELVHNYTKGSKTRASVWLTSLGVSLWLDSQIEAHLRFIRGNYLLSPALTEAISGKIPPLPKKNPKNEANSDKQKRVSAEVSPPSKAVISAAIRSRIRASRHGDTPPRSEQAARSAKDGAHSRVEKSRPELALNSPPPDAANLSSVGAGSIPQQVGVAHSGPQTHVGDGNLPAKIAS